MGSWVFVTDDVLHLLLLLHCERAVLAAPSPLVLLSWAELSCIVFVHAFIGPNFCLKFNLFVDRIYKPVNGS